MKVLENGNALRNATTIASRSMHANQMRLKIATQNAANVKSFDYIPQSVEYHAAKTKEGITTVEVKKIHSHHNRVKKIHDPDNIHADEEGMVTMPDLNPITVLMDLQDIKQSQERDLKVHEVVTDLQHKIIKLMSN